MKEKLSKEEKKRLRRERRQKFAIDFDDIKSEHASDMTINKSKFHVGWDELFYDLIFVIVLAHMAEMMFVEEEAAPLLIIVAQASLFLNVFWMWAVKVRLINMRHILKEKVQVNIPSFKFITMFEMMAVLLYIHSIEGIFTFEDWILGFIITIFFIILSEILMRNSLKFTLRNDMEKYEEVIEEYGDIRKEEINPGHIIERLGIVIILLFGEVLKVVFAMEIEVPAIIFMLVIVFDTFSTYFRIINCVEYRIVDEGVSNVFMIVSYIVPMFLFLILMIMQLEYYHHIEAINTTLLMITVFANKAFGRFALETLDDIWATWYEIVSLIIFVVITYLFLTEGIEGNIAIFLVLLMGTIQEARNKLYNQEKKKYVTNINEQETK